MYISESPSKAICVFAAEDGAASYLSGDLITFTFRIPENILGGDTLSVTLWVDQICGENGKPLESLSSISKTIQIPIADANGDLLARLKPDCGSLSPVFSPTVFSYTLHVPSSTKEVHFEAEAQNGAEISISRYRLQAAGKTTEIRITLTSADKRKTVYLVTVYRDSESSTEDGHSEKRPPKEILLTRIMRVLHRIRIWQKARIHLQMYPALWHKAALSKFYKTTFLNGHPFWLFSFQQLPLS